MRKALLFLSLLLALAVGSTVYLSEEVYATRDVVTVTPVVHYGDISALEGAEVTLRANYGYRLFWDVNYRFEDAAVTKAATEYYYSPTKEYEVGNPSFSGVSLYSDACYLLNHDELAEGETLTGWEKMSQEAADATPNGTERTHTFRLADYLDYYPWSLSVDLPYPISHTDAYDFDWLLPAEQKTAAEIRDFFRIPVLENEYVNITVAKDDAGNVYSMGSGSGMNPAPEDNIYSEDYFNGVPYNAVTAEACFFTMNGLSGRGAPIDFSHIPGGYGIYRLPYGEPTYGANGEMLHTGIRAEELEMVYPLRQDMEISYFAPTHDESRLILCTIEDGEYIFTAIDAHTMETLQRFTLCAWPQDGWVGLTYVEEDFFVAYVNAADGSETLILLTRDEAGDYHVEFAVDSGLEHDPNPYKGDTVMAYDGEKLISLSLLYYGDGYGQDTCNLAASVYDATGLLYCGEYRTSLTTESEFASWNYPIEPMRYQALKLTW